MPSPFSLIGKCLQKVRTYVTEHSCPSDSPVAELANAPEIDGRVSITSVRLERYTERSLGPTAPTGMPQDEPLG